MESKSMPTRMNNTCNNHCFPCAKSTMLSSKNNIPQGECANIKFMKQPPTWDQAPSPIQSNEKRDQFHRRKRDANKHAKSQKMKAKEETFFFLKLFFKNKIKKRCSQMNYFCRWPVLSRGERRVGG